MAIINRIAAFAEDMTAWRRHLHSIPELDFDLPQTAAFVASRLREFGVDEIHEGIARSGIVALVRGQATGAVVGLRADMDALPIAEAGEAPWRSLYPGRMHACGHDGHMTGLLGAARYLAETRNFAGTVALIFQPSEEMSGGARVMCEEGIFERFGIDRVFALHNAPNVELGAFFGCPGPTMAATDEFAVTFRGCGGHAAYPHQTRDPVAAAVLFAQGLYAIPARRSDPLSALVVAPTMLRAGDATNVVPETAFVGGTVRSLDEGVRQLVAGELRRMAEAAAKAHRMVAEIDYQFGYPVTVNDPAEFAFALGIAAEVAGPERVNGATPARMGAEDFAYMLQARPGAYLFLGTGPGANGGAGLHHPAFDYNDAASPIAASWFARLAEAALPIGRA